MENKDIIDILFEKKDDDDIFCVDKEKFKQLYRKIALIEDDIEKILDTQVNPKCRKRLKRLIRKHTILTYKSDTFFYKNGVHDGMNLILFGLSSK